MARLFDPKRGPKGKFPFDYVSAPATDVRSTWDRLCPGWRERQPGEQKPERVTEIRRKAR